MSVKDFFKFVLWGSIKTDQFKMINPYNGDEKKMAFGFNWQILLFGGFFGLPLFFKRLWGWAWFMFLLSSIQFFNFYVRLKQILSASTLQDFSSFGRPDPVDAITEILLLACSVLLAFKGNEWSVKRLLEKGWEFENKNDPNIKKVVQKWKIYEQPVIEKEEKF